jgi:hypothetical protein
MGLQLTLEDADQIINSTDQIKTEVTKHNNEEAWQNNPYTWAPAPPQFWRGKSELTGLEFFLILKNGAGTGNEDIDTYSESVPELTLCILSYILLFKN